MTEDRNSVTAVAPATPGASAQTGSPPPDPGADMIVARALTRMYGDFYAARDISFTIGPAQVVAFLGPNGAGKSTTMKMLTGALAPTRGDAFIAGINVRTHRLEAARQLGYLPENGPLYPDMTARSLLAFFARVRGLSPARFRDRLEYVVEHCRLTEVIGKPIGKLSRGYRQRVGMAQALIHDPPVLILDEPTAGLDPNQVEHVRALLRDLARTRTILLSTHILREVRAIASRVVFVAQGRLVHDGDVASLGPGEAQMEERFHALSRAS